MRALAASVIVVSLVCASPTEAKLAYQKLGERNTSDGIYLARDDGSHARRVVGGYHPYLSPSGHRIAYFGKHRLGLHVVGAGGRRSRLVLRYAFDIGVAWSPDDRYLVAARAFEGDSRTHLVDLEAGTSRPVGRGYRFTGASFAPDGRRFAIGDASDEGSDVRVFRMEPFVSRVVAGGQDPVWGARGLAFLGSASSGGGIMFRRHGRNRVVARGGVPIDWSANGRVLLVFHRTSPGRAGLVRPATGESTRIPADLSGVWGLSDDGRQVLATRGRDVVSVTADGRVKTLVREATHPSWTK